MDVCRTIASLRRARAHYDQLGLVPTMGFLHEGHLSLARQARAECDGVIVSIFVNPTQFGPGEDFAQYPRNLERDLTLLQQAGVDLVFVPDGHEIYPAGFASSVEVGGVTEMLEGNARPGHFRGVTTVVCKLFHIVQPHRAYFGQKDAQQTIVVGKMVRDLNMPVEIVVCPTVREPDGLALSSRNAYLGPAERMAATVLYRALTTAQQRFAAGVRTGNALRTAMREVLDAEPLACIDYVSAADPETLREVDAIGEHGVLLSMAVRIGTTRLIDNMLLQHET